MLECPECGNELESRTCESCQGDNLPDAKFCCYCGESLAELLDRPVSDDPYDLENRVLCSDENCIGVINEQGICSECGRPAGFKEQPTESEESQEV